MALLRALLLLVVTRMVSSLLVALALALLLGEAARAAPDDRAPERPIGRRDGFQFSEYQDKASLERNRVSGQQVKRTPVPRRVRRRRGSAPSYDQRRRLCPRQRASRATPGKYRTRRGSRGDRRRVLLCRGLA